MTGIYARQYLLVIFIYSIHAIGIDENLKEYLNVGWTPNTVNIHCREPGWQRQQQIT